VAGSASASFSDPALTATIYYSTDNGAGWTTTEPTPVTSVTTIQWWLSAPLPPSKDGTAAFQVFIPADYGLPPVENCGNLQYGNGPSVAEACATTIITGSNSIGDFVWQDENANGRQDDGATGIDGVPVSLYYDADGDGELNTAADVLITSAITAGGGSYLFSNLADGNYLVAVDTTDPDLPYGYKITTAKVFNVDLDSTHASSAAVDYLNADFGFGPALSVTKSLLTAAAYEGRDIQYRIDVSNLRSSAGESVGNSCIYTVWSDNFVEAGTDWTDPSGGAISNADNIFSSSGPNGLYAVGDFGGNGDVLRADTYDVSAIDGPISKVEAIYSFYKGGGNFATNNDTQALPGRETINEGRVSAIDQNNNLAPVASDTDTVGIINPGLEVEKLVDIAAVAPNQEVTYTIRITNTGDITLTTVAVTDTLPAGFSYVTGSGNPAPDSMAGGQLV
jgi:uncharacterized repeat protein (TIGR01451 family)